ncbi:hypothetical protein ACTA71_002272 [Dictyostelium dimigraforme]
MKINYLILISFLIIKLLVIEQVQSYGEPNLRGNPNWFERSNHVLVNAVRIAPKEYQNKYTQFGNQDVLSPSIYPSVPPVFFEFSLGASALAHARDMSINNCFSHESCDGTDVDTRINQYYHCDEIHGENIAAGYDSPLITNNQWVCDDGSNDPYSNPTCAQDASGSDGHRANIMNPNFKALGVGFSFTSDSTYHSYWTQDFGAQPCFNISNQPIHSGSHLFLEQNKLTFMVDWYDASEPTVAYVVISGKPHKMNLEMGSKSKGIYSLSVPMVIQKPEDLKKEQQQQQQQLKSKAQEVSNLAKRILHLDSCRDYYFYFEKSIVTNTTNTTIQVTDKGNVTLTSFSFSKSTEIFRYPHFGYLTTFGEGNCKRSYSINGTEYSPYANLNSTTGMHTSTSSWSSTSSTSSWSSTSSTSSWSSTSSTSSSSTVSSTMIPSTTNNNNNNNNGGNGNNSEQPSATGTSTTMEPTTSTTSTTTTTTTIEPGTSSSTIQPSTSSSTTTTTTTSTTGSSSSSVSDTYNSFESSIEIFNGNHKFVGCFNDEISHDLPFNEIFSINMTNDKCESYCTKNGFKFAGTELGTQCYCGNSYGHYGKARKESDCHFKCGGDKSKICGGNDKISVYKTSYNGCFSYEPLISHFSISASSPNMTVEGCRAHCFKNHYLIAGLSRGNLCFCGNETVFEQQSEIKPISNQTCNIKCSGSIKENCGGVNEISIYSTDNLSNLLVPDDLKDTSSLLSQNQQENNSSLLLSLQSYLLLLILTVFVTLI